jgi:outer membrane protein assembly factor BamB
MATRYGPINSRRPKILLAHLNCRAKWIFIKASPIKPYSGRWVWHISGSFTMTNSKFSPLLKLFVLTGLLVFLTSSAHAWRVTIPDCQGCGSRAETVVVDAAGDVIAAGYASYGGDVVKLSGTTGQMLWQYNPSHNLSEQPVTAIALDSHGDVFLLFATKRGVTKISGITGTRIWEKPIGGTVSKTRKQLRSAIKVRRFIGVVLPRGKDR